jgi:hypothetical protein
MGRLKRLIFIFCIPLIAATCSKPTVRKNKIDKEKHHHTYRYTVHLFPVADLPPEISESSGLIMTGTNSFWTHNDSRGKPDLFNIDSLGILKRKITLSNENNIDWEEITRDISGNVYLGDFGNNECKRRQEMIYKIPNPDHVKSDTLSAQDIIFTYPDQFDFPPENSNMNFDAEAMIEFKQSVYIFSKNRSEPYSGYSKLYRVPALPGRYVAQLVDSFYTGHAGIKENSITGAAINNSHTTLVLISHEKIWVFSNFTGDHFFEGNVTELSFYGKNLSMEGVCFKSENELYLTEERSAPGSGKIFYLNLKEILEL